MTFRSGLKHTKKKGGAESHLIFLYSLEILDTEGGQLHPGTNHITHVSNSHFTNMTCMPFLNDGVAHHFLHLAALLQSISVLPVS